MISVSNHNCKTTFVGGVNPWGTYVPREPRKPRNRVTGPKERPLCAIEQLLSDSKPRRLVEIAQILDKTIFVVDDRLRDLLRRDLVFRERRLLEIDGVTVNKYVYWK